MSEAILLFVTIDLVGAELASFEDYESRVLALVPEHRGALLARWRLADDTTEHHLISFADQAGYDSYMADERRLAIRPLWMASRASIKVDEVRRV